MNTKEFIEKAQSLYGSIYNYSLSEYTGERNLLKIICEKHGLFEKTPRSFLQYKQICPQCQNELNNHKFIEKAQNVHKGKYDYSLVQYISSKEPVKIICKEHGVFEQTPNCHLSGRGCPKCWNYNQLSYEQFLSRVPKDYDYSKVNYVNNSTSIEVVCSKHGSFWIKPYNLMRLQTACPKCRTFTKEDFVLKAQAIFDDKYDYSLFHYTGMQRNIKVICKEHGTFNVTPEQHLKGVGCPACLKTRNFLEQATKIHNGKYRYKDCVVFNNNSFVNIECREHGIFSQSVEKHLQGQGCPKCNPFHKLTTEEFIEKAQNIHKGKYDYSLVHYVNRSTSIQIICPTHGLFEQRPEYHLSGCGCQKCGAHINTITTESFKKRAKAVHKDLYDYSKVDCENSLMKVEIICKNHGSFWQSAKGHLSGIGCPSCSKEKQIDKFKNNFINKALVVHNKVYNYDKVVYINTNTKVEIICKKHDSFWQRPIDHLKGQGCPKCKQSKGELEISKWLDEHNVAYETQKKFIELGNLRYDFYVPQWNLLIEYNGIQHYKFNKFFHKDEHDFHYQKHRDWLKRKFAQAHNMKLLVISYTDDVSYSLYMHIQKCDYCNSLCPL